MRIGANAVEESLSFFLSNEPLFASSKSAGGKCVVKSDATKCKACAIAGSSDIDGRNIKLASCPSVFSLP